MPPQPPDQRAPAADLPVARPLLAELDRYQPPSEVLASCADLGAVCGVTPVESATSTATQIYADESFGAGWRARERDQPRSVAVEPMVGSAEPARLKWRYAADGAGVTEIFSAPPVVGLGGDRRADVRYAGPS